MTAESTDLAAARAIYEACTGKLTPDDLTALESALQTALNNPPTMHPANLIRARRDLSFASLYLQKGLLYDATVFLGAVYTALWSATTPPQII